MPDFGSNIRMILDHQPSPIDAAEIYHFSDGRRQVVYPDAEKKAAEQAEIAQHWARHAVETERENAITDRVKSYVAAGAGVDPGDARGRLEAHRTWMERTATAALAAAATRAETAAAVQRHADNQAALVALEAAVAAAFEDWVHFSSAGPQPRPDPRLAERAALRAVIDADASAAQVAPAAAFEATVAERAAAALALMLPLREMEALVAAEMPAIEARIRTAVVELASAYADLAALDSVASLDQDLHLDLGLLGVERPHRLVREQTVNLPALPAGSVAFGIKADVCSTTRYRLALAAQHTTTEHHGNVLQPPLSAPASFVARALSAWKGE